MRSCNEVIGFIYEKNSNYLDEDLYVSRLLS